MVPTCTLKERPGSLLVLTSSGELLDRTRAVRHVLSRMSPGWRFLGVVLSLIPTCLADLVYSLVARWRPRRRACGRTPMDGRFDP